MTTKKQSADEDERKREDLHRELEIMILQKGMNIWDITDYILEREKQQSTREDALLPIVDVPSEDDKPSIPANVLSQKGASRRNSNSIIAGQNHITTDSKKVSSEAALRVAIDYILEELEVRTWTASRENGLTNPKSSAGLQPTPTLELGQVPLLFGKRNKNLDQIMQLISEYCGERERKARNVDGVVKLALTARINELNFVLQHASGGGSWRRIIISRIAKLESELQSAGQEGKKE